MVPSFTSAMLACAPLIFSTLLSAPIAPQESKSSSSSQAEALPIYSNTGDGLRQLLQDMRTAARNQDNAKLSAQKLDAAMMYDTLRVPLDLYLADWKKSNGPNGQKPDHIGYFMFVDGKFRWNSAVEFFRVQKSNRGGLVPAKLIKRVAPEYPP